MWSSVRSHAEASAMPSVAAIQPVTASASSMAARSGMPPPPPPTPVAELPEAPKPVTPATAAVHIMKVPTSRVVEAFAMLERARGQQNAQTVSETPAPKPAWPAPAPRRQIDLEA
jgi:hypothetical protein